MLFFHCTSISKLYPRLQSIPLRITKIVTHPKGWNLCKVVLKYISVVGVVVVIVLLTIDWYVYNIPPKSLSQKNIVPRGFVQKAHGWKNKVPTWYLDKVHYPTFILPPILDPQQKKSVKHKLTNGKLLPLLIGFFFSNFWWGYKGKVYWNLFSSFFFFFFHLKISINRSSAMDCWFVSKIKLN